MNENLEDHLNRIQADIAVHGPGANYLAYRDQERLYWKHVPAWIAQQPKGIRVMDVGCAYGTLLILAKRLLDADAVGVDALGVYYPEALFAKEGIPMRLRNIEQDAIEDFGRFDLILFTEVIEHLNFHPRSTLRKLRAALKSDGRLIVTTPNGEDPAWGRVTEFYPSLDAMPDPEPGRPWIDGHIWQYTGDELRRVLEESGFAIEAFALSPGVAGSHLNVLARAV